MRLLVFLLLSRYSKREVFNLEADMPIDDSQTPYNQSQLEQLYLSTQASKRMNLDSIFWEINTSKQSKNMITKLLQEEFVEAKDLAEVSGLSRSAALNRADDLVQKGVIRRTIKPGTENRHKPPYIFFLEPEVRSQLVEWLEKKGVEWQDHLIKQDEIKESGQDLQPNEVQLSPTKQEPQQLDFSDEILKEEVENRVVVSSLETKATSGQVPRTEKLLDNAAERKQEATSKIDEESLSLQKQIGVVLTKMAKEIEALRYRVAYLEQKLEQKTQDTDSFDFAQVLSILERKQNDKDTT